MKTMKNTFMVLIILGFSVGFNSCKKDSKDSGDVVSEKYFTIEDATFVKEDFPSASSGSVPVINAVSGNTNILEGGSNPISITTSSTIKDILIGVEGKSGYYKLDVNSLKSTLNTYLIYLLFSQNFETEEFTIIISIVDSNGQVSEHHTIDVSRITAGTGKLQVSCSWNKANDLDLHLVEPNDNEIYWDADSSANGGFLDVDSNPACFIDNINNENITYSGKAVVEKGKYIVRICLFSSCDVTELTNYVVTARLDGELLTPTVGTNPYYGSIEAAHSYVDGDGPREGYTVMEFNVPTTKSLKVSNEKMLMFRYHNKPNYLKKSMLNR
jgi:hypothetical protein